jgi:hypothetical protein
MHGTVEEGFGILYGLDGLEENDVNEKINLV